MPKLPVYPWFDQVPDHMKTKNQLGELGLKPGGPIVARVEWGYGRKAKVAYLYDVSQAVAKRPLSAQARNTIEAQKLARRTCPVCRRVHDHILWSPTCEDCGAYGPNGQPYTIEGHFAAAFNNPDSFRVWLPEDTPFGPYAAPVDEHHRWVSWIPYPKTEFRLVLYDREFGPLLSGHSHAWFYGRPIAALLAEWTPSEFVALAEIWPVLREWAIDASLPSNRFVELAVAGLDRAAATELRFTWYERRTTYYRDMKEYL